MGSQRLGPGSTGVVAIKKQDDPARVREIAQVINYMASPFGTAEELYMQWGEEGRHHTWDDKLKTPVFTDTGLAEVGREFTYIGCNPFIVFNPGYSAQTKAFCALERKIIPAARQTATLGLYSRTNDGKGVGLSTALDDGIGQIMQGRRPMGDLTKLVGDYKTAGGDEIRHEFEDAYAQAHQGR